MPTALPLVKDSLDTPRGELLLCSKLPKSFILSIVLISCLPLALNLLGVDFGLKPELPDASILSQDPLTLANRLHQSLAGSFLHTLLEWSAVCVAIFTVVLAFAYFSIQQDVITPILGVTLLGAGLMDAFHTLAADRLLTTVADNQDLIPFTWALCRLGNALLTLLGVSLFLVKSPKRWRGNSLFVGLVSVGFALLAYGVIHWCAISQHLPQTTFPNTWISRPWDVVPLLVFVGSGLWVYPIFYRRYPSLFSHALLISTIPNAATQLHMAFGSTALFDNHFNIAHFLKIVAYVVPLAGLVLDYIQTHRQMRQTNLALAHEIEERQQIQANLEDQKAKERERSRQLKAALQDLQTMQTQLIQAEKMSSLGQMVGGLAHEINNPISFVHGNLAYLEQYLQDLLTLNQLYQAHYPEPHPNIAQKVQEMDLAFVQEDADRLIQSMRMGTTRVREIVKSLRSFSRLGESEVKAVDIHDGLESTLVILSSRLEKPWDNTRIQVIKQYGSLPLVECYASQLNQVLMHLLNNAIDAIEERWERGAYQPDPFVPQIHLHTQVLSSERIQIAIADNGTGIAPENQARLFNPFFTTKPVGKGTGMGLSISYQIIKHHGGSLRCVSMPGAGAEFIIELPVRLHPATSEPSAESLLSSYAPSHPSR